MKLKNSTGSPPPAQPEPFSGVNPLQFPKVRFLKPDVSDLCERYGISRPTAYRHLKANTLPSSTRKKGNDGKMYPVGNGRKLPKPSKSETEKDLQTIRRAFDRLVSRGAIVTEAERKLLVEIFGIVGSLLAARKECAA